MACGRLRPVTLSPSCVRPSGGCPTPDRPIDACLRISRFLPCKTVSKRPGCVLVIRVSPLCSPTYPQTEGRSTAHNPGSGHLPHPSLSKSWAQHPEVDFLGPLSSKPPPASSAKSFPDLWCLQPTLWAHTLPEQFWRRVGEVGGRGVGIKASGAETSPSW